MRDHRRTQPALVHRPLLPAQSTATLKRLPSAGRTVVRTKKQKRLIRYRQFAQQVDDLPDLRIDFCHHRRIDFLVIRPRLIVPRARVGDFISTVRQCPRQIEKERPIAVVANEITGKVKNHIVGIIALPTIPIAFENDLLLIAPQIRRIVRMRVALIEVAKPFVKPLARGNARRTGFAQPPFAGDARGIAHPLEHLGNRKILRFERHPLLIAHPAHNAKIVPHPRVSTVQPRHQHGPRRRANRRSGIALREPHRLGREVIQSGRGNDLLPVTPQIAIADIVTQNKDDIWRFHRAPS